MTQPPIDPEVRTALLAFVDSVVPGGGESVWLTGSRARGDARPDSDWDVIAFTADAPSDPARLFEGNQIGRLTGIGEVELVIAHPSAMSDPRCYMSGWRKHRIRLR